MNKTFVNLLKLFTLARILGLFSVSQLFLTNRHWTFIDVSDDSSLVWSFYSALLRSPCVPCAFPLLICITVKSMTSPIVIT